MDERDLSLLTGDEKIVEEAKIRFRRCQDWEAVARQRWLDDVKFANADSDNGYQWPGDLLDARVSTDKPIITINKTRQHNLQIVNDAKQNKPSIKIRPANNEASFKAAEVYEGLVRHTEYISAAQDAYDYITEQQVDGGIGYIRVLSEYIDDDTFDQELLIAAIKDTLSVYMDRDIKMQSGIDSRYVLIFEDIPRDRFVKENPDFELETPSEALGNTDDGNYNWVTENYVRQAEYYRIVEKKDELIALQNGKTVLKSAMPHDLYKSLPKDAKKREVTHKTVEWFKIAGDKIIDRRVGDDAWKGKYIPVLRVVGRETIIDGIMDRVGHTRALKDPQRMYNYNSAASIEFGALQTKIPWKAPIAAVEDNIDDWTNANNENLALLTYNHMDDEGNPIPEPTRIEPPQGSQFYVESMQLSNQDMMFVSGQYEADFGQKSNEVSGKAINERVRKGETATFHFIDNLAKTIRDLGKILIDLYPKYYDTQRIIKIMGEDGQEQHVMLDPNAPQALEEKKSHDAVQLIFNPNIGKYDVEADIGPAYATRRQEAWNAMEQIATNNPESMNLIGDLLFLNADFPGADKIAERYRDYILPKTLGNDPQVNELKEQLTKSQKEMAKLNETTAKLMSELAMERIKLKGKDQMREIEAFEAYTKRMEAVADIVEKHLGTPRQNKEMVHDIMTTQHESNLNLVEATANHDMALELQANEPQPQAGQ